MELYYIFDFDTGLMKDFVWDNDKEVWLYKTNKDVLKLIKKTSN